MPLQSLFHSVWAFKWTWYLALAHKALHNQERAVMEVNIFFWGSFCHFFYLPIVINWMTCSFLSSKVYNFDFWAAQTCERKWCNTDPFPVSFGFQINVVSWVIWESRVHSPLVMELKGKQRLDNSKGFGVLYFWEVLILNTLPVLVSVLRTD